MVKKVHGGGVTQHMRRDFLPLERRAGSFSATGVLSDETLDRISTKPTATNAGKGWMIRQSLAFAEPNLDRPCCFRAEWCAAPFSALAQAAHVGARPQDDILAVEPNQLGNPQPCLDANQKKCPIPPSQPIGKVGSGEECINFFPVEKLDGPPLMAFIRYRKNPLAMQRQCGLL
jgi:hypothetical protein